MYLGYLLGYFLAALVWRIYPKLVTAEVVLQLLQIGDRIVSICGTSAEGMSHSQAVTLLKNATGTVQLQVGEAHTNTTAVLLFLHWLDEPKDTGL